MSISKLARFCLGAALAVIVTTAVVPGYDFECDPCYKRAKLVCRKDPCNPCATVVEPRRGFRWFGWFRAEPTYYSDGRGNYYYR
ncbi:MAG: hypothetical protein LIP23_10335 [Planctomycetes bacterium]|nr:hypothetical protein [Planctomycetota bacterium]